MIIRKYLNLRKQRQDALLRVHMAHNANRAVMDVFHEMVACIGIEEMESLLEKAKDRGDKYVCLAQWYIDTLRARKN